MLKKLINDLKRGLIDGDRELAVAIFAEAMLTAIADAKLTDEEVSDLCAMYDRLGITTEDWDTPRPQIWTAACKAAANNGLTKTELRELRGIRAFLGTMDDAL